MRTNWLQKYCSSQIGIGGSDLITRQYYIPATENESHDSDPLRVYQSVDLPWVFLGGVDPAEIEMAQKIAGERICMRIDLTDANTKDLQFTGNFRKIPLPEYHIWTYERYNKTQNTFNQAVDFLINQINALKCPIYVHCSLGANRSVSVLAAAISRITGRSVFDILHEMRTQRHVVDPFDIYVMMAIDNSTNEFDVEHREEIGNKVKDQGNKEILRLNPEVTRKIEEQDRKLELSRDNSEL